MRRRGPSAYPAGAPAWEAVAPSRPASPPRPSGAERGHREAENYPRGPGEAGRVRKEVRCVGHLQALRKPRLRMPGLPKPVTHPPFLLFRFMHHRVWCSVAVSLNVQIGGLEISWEELKRKNAYRDLLTGIIIPVR